MPICDPVPFVFTNGTTADAVQVDANFDSIVADVNANAAEKSMFPGGILDPASGGTGADMTSFTQNAVLVAGASGEVVETVVFIVPATGAIQGFRTTFNTQSGTSYTVNSSTDGGKSIQFTNGSAIAVVLPKNAAVGFYAEAIQMGAGQITFAAEAGGALKSYNNQYKTAGQYAGVSLRVTSNAGNAAQWVLTGATAA